MEKVKQKITEIREGLEHKKYNKKYNNEDINEDIEKKIQEVQEIFNEIKKDVKATEPFFFDFFYFLVENKNTNDDPKAIAIMKELTFIKNNPPSVENGVTGITKNKALAQIVLGCFLKNSFPKGDLKKAAQCWVNARIDRHNVKDCIKKYQDYKREIRNKDLLFKARGYAGKNHSNSVTLFLGAIVRKLKGDKPADENIEGGQKLSIYSLPINVHDLIFENYR